MFTGFTIGAVLAGIAGATLIPRFGWQAMFAVGGVLPFVISIFLWFVLPESVRFLTLREHGWGELRSVIQRMLPGHNVPENARFVIHEGAREDSFTPRLLFAGSLLFITPLLWLFYIFNSAAVFFMQSWMPVLIHGIGLSESNAALTTSVYSLGGTIGGLVTGQIIDRLGLSAVAILPLAGVALCVMVGLPISVTPLELSVFALGFFVVGAQFACTAIAPVFYPTSLSRQRGRMGPGGREDRLDRRASDWRSAARHAPARLPVVLFRGDPAITECSFCVLTGSPVARLPGRHGAHRQTGLREDYQWHGSICVQIQ